VNGVDLSKLTIGLKGSADLLVELAYGAARRQRARDCLGDSSDVNVMEAAALTIQMWFLLHCRSRLLCWFLDAGKKEAPQAQLTGVQKAPRHEVAGSWAPTVQRVL
jgi:hypothetical protein